MDKNSTTSLMPNIGDCLIIGFDRHQGESTCLIVGRKEHDKINIINVLKDEEADEVYKRLINIRGDMYENKG